MTKLATLELAGASGRKYPFNVYPLDTRFTHVGAVYAVTRRTKSADGSFSHTKIYIGQTEDVQQRFDDHHKAPCFARHGANCICIHRDDNERSRLAKEKDLIAAGTPVCNE